MKSALFFAAGLALVMAARAEEGAPLDRVALETSKGKIVIELDSAKAPQTVGSFLANVREGFYDGTTFHRVIPRFMIQGGGVTRDLQLKPTTKSLFNEAANGLKNVRGSVAMARKPDPHSASVQFFINLVHNTSLDHTAKTPQGWGYAVFGKVVEGMDVVDAIARVKTGRGDVPVEPVLIVKASVVGE